MQITVLHSPPWGHEPLELHATGIATVRDLDYIEQVTLPQLRRVFAEAKSAYDALPDPYEILNTVSKGYRPALAPGMGAGDHDRHGE